MLKLNKLHFAKYVSGPRFCKFQGILKRIMTSCVDEPRRVASISNDEFVNDVFDLGEISTGDGDKFNTVTKEIFNQCIKRWQVPLLTTENNTFAVGHFLAYGRQKTVYGLSGNSKAAVDFGRELDAPIMRSDVHPHLGTSR
jgi:hypothetical protein